MRETRYKVLWDSCARGRPSFSPHQCTASVQCLTAHAFFMQGSFSFSLDTLGSAVHPCCPGHSCTRRRPPLSGLSSQSSSASSRVGPSPDLPALRTEGGAQCSASARSASREACPSSPRMHAAAIARECVFNSPRSFCGVSPLHDRFSLVFLMTLRVRELTRGLVLWDFCTVYVAPARCF